MDEIEEEPPTPPTPASPFWLSNRHTGRWNPLLNTGLHVAFLSIVAILLMVVVTPSLLSQAQQFFIPSSFKRGWGTINILLVAFAILCGFLRNKDDDKGNEDVDTSSPQYGQHYNWESGNVTRVNSLRRASSSYPDLIRQEMMWDHNHDPRPRYYDDSYYVNQYRKSPILVDRSSSIEGFKSHKLNSFNKIGKKEKDDVNVMEVDQSVSVNAPNESPQRQKLPTPPPPPPPPPPPEARSRRQSESIGRRVAREGGRRKLEDQSPASKSPPAPLPPPPPATSSTTSTRGRRASGEEYEDIRVRTKVNKESPPPALEAVSVDVRQDDESNRRRIRREGQARRSPENESTPPRESRSTISVETKTAPRQEYDRAGGYRANREARSAQPPPAEIGSSQKKRGSASKEKIASIYQHSKKKNRRGSHENLEDLISTNPNPHFPHPSQAPPPPPPPPPPSFFHNIFSSKKSRSRKKSPPLPTPQPRRRRPPLNTSPRSFDRMIERIGSEYLPYPIPPPPPPPPFKVPAWKFVVEGDYVKITGSPLRDDEGEENTPTASPVFMPSPDVNMKADDFIARFRAKLKLEKMNSVRKHNQEMVGTSFSPLGPDSSPSPS